MKKNFLNLTLLFVLLLNICNAYSQVQNKSKYNFNFIGNAENFSGSSNETEGLVMVFDFYNKDKKTGNGGGWIIHKDGTKIADKIAFELYPNNNLRGYAFIKDLFNVKHKNPNVDSTMLKDFDIYLYIIDVKFLEYKLNFDGEGAGKTYSYFEKFPLDIIVYKREAGKDYFLKCEAFHANNEDEYLKLLSLMSNYRKRTAIESNNLK